MKEEGSVPRDQQHSDQCLIAPTAERDSNMREVMREGAEVGLNGDHASGNIHTDRCVLMWLFDTLN